MDWTIHNDRQSITVGINYRISLCLRSGQVPSLIRLGPSHSLLFWREHGVSYIPTNGYKLPPVVNDVSWDEKSRLWLYSRRHIPMQFNDALIWGIAVEGRIST